ncbi:hypothetical protein K457DRAFT_750753 [Linnemannia elongata AG-77]|uniref:Uncharacterized protein n=1 Tax=Linnemannia elongata AG-77 TaxID=1314771 RepID=A0A197JKW3_9FUNG|nr:hypothetical protein K457DRAFT_750753 [Linnemannia elongata AG-77]
MDGRDNNIIRSGPGRLLIDEPASQRSHMSPVLFSLSAFLPPNSHPIVSLRRAIHRMKVLFHRYLCLTIGFSPQPMDGVHHKPTTFLCFFFVSHYAAPAHYATHCTPRHLFFFLFLFFPRKRKSEGNKKC